MGYHASFINQLPQLIRKISCIYPILYFILECYSFVYQGRYMGGRGKYIYTAKSIDSCAKSCLAKLQCTSYVFWQSRISCYHFDGTIPSHLFYQAGAKYYGKEQCSLGRLFLNLVELT